MFEDTFKELLEKYKGRSPSYKVRLTVCPDWYEILSACSPKLKTPGEINLFVKEQMPLCDEASSLIFKDFTFVAFYDQVSGMTQFWSSFHKNFLDCMEIRGRIFDYKTGNRLPKEYLENNKNFKLDNWLVINPEFIGFDTILPDGSIMDDCKLAQIAFNQTVWFFVNSYTTNGISSLLQHTEMKAVKTFDKLTTEYFKKYTTTYDIDSYNHEDYGCGTEFNKSKIIKLKDGTEFYDQKMKFHIIKNKFYQINFTIEIFS